MSPLNFDIGTNGSEVDSITQRQTFNVHHLLQRHVRAKPDELALVGSNSECTYRELDTRTTKLANGLLDRGLEANEGRIAIVAENRPEIAELFYAGSKAGLLIAPQNWRLDKREFTHCIDVVKPDLVVVSDEHGKKRDWIEDSAETDPGYVTLDDSSFGESYEDVLADGTISEPAPAQSVHPDQGIAVLYTSGTTGLPKGVVLSHRTFVARVGQWVVDLEFESSDSYIAWGAMFHQGGIDPLFYTAHLGGTYYTVDGFQSDRIVELLQEGPVSWLMLVPGVIQRLIDYIEENDVDTSEFAEIRTIGALIDLISTEKVAQITELLDAPYQCTYGATEDGQMASTNQVAIGVKPTDNDIWKAQGSFIRIKLVDDDFEEVTKGEPGEMIVRGPTVCSGYMNNPEANREDFTDGWFHTGDIFVEVEDGQYDFIDRVKYMLKTGGENIYPGEIEQPLLELPGVSDATVVRVPDEEWSEVPKAYISTDQPEEFDPEEILEYLRERIANYKLPHYIEIVEPGNFPRSETGKIIRDEVEEWSVSEDERIRNP